MSMLLIVFLPDISDRPAESPTDMVAILALNKDTTTIKLGVVSEGIDIRHWEFKEWGMAVGCFE
jgi:hypothetical protein